jgi:glycosyltransferase involved in cell wall biosynthesis
LGLGNVEFAGHMQGSDLDRAIANSRFTVLPSHAYETLGKTILESYAQARAVVATDLGSRRELVCAGKTGLLYSAGDVEQLATAVEFLGSQPELADKMGRAGQEQIRQNYRPEAHYERLIELYERLANGKRRSSATSVKTPSPVLVSITAPQKKVLRIAFIGGRGVISKYSGIET